MRLLSTDSLVLQEFPPDKIPPYAILSHTWIEQEEVSYKEFRSASSQTQKKEGYRKIAKFCEQAKRDGLAYGWVDTCCIDKRSSAELSEAINSMYRWYSKAKTCYVYLYDVHSHRYREDLGLSRWFSRGWTLQELLAPSEVKFYDKEWDYISDKGALASLISDVTMIASTILTGSISIFTQSVAKRMSWASRRQTTREEDMAYCLMGIFDVSMPLLYGEGKRAFFRLQEEILKASNDQTIFAWQYTKPDQQTSSLLASHPREFYYCDELEDNSRLPEFAQFGPITTVSGMGVKTDVFLLAVDSRLKQYKAFLKCTKAHDPYQFVSIRLFKTSDIGNEYVRRNSPTNQEDAGLQMSSLDGTITTIFVPHNVQLEEPERLRLKYFTLYITGNCVPFPIRALLSSKYAVTPADLLTHKAPEDRLASDMWPSAQKRGTKLEAWYPGAALPHEFFTDEEVLIDGEFHHVVDPIRSCFPFAWYVGREVVKLQMHVGALWIYLSLGMSKGGLLGYKLSHQGTGGKSMSEAFKGLANGDYLTQKTDWRFGRNSYQFWMRAVAPNTIVTENAVVVEMKLDRHLTMPFR